jgi:hypothetical protein
MTIQSALSPTGSLGGEISKETVGLSEVDNTSDLDKPVSTAQQEILDTKLNITDALTVQGAITFYLADDILALPVGGTSDVISITPLAITEQTGTVTVKLSTSPLIYGSYISVPLGVGIIQAGDYDYNFYRKVSTADGVSNLIYKWYLYHVDDSKTLIFTHTGLEIDATVNYSSSEFTANVAASIACEVTDRLLLEIYATTTNATDVIVSVAHGGSTHNSNVLTPIQSAVGSILQASLDLKANILGPTFLGLATLSTGTTTIAPLKMVAGTLNTVPQSGAIEFDGTDWFISF